jgi:hypothetical protein
MFGLDAVWIVVILAVGCLAEIALLWAATGLADAPDLPLARLAGVGVGTFLACFAATAAIAHSLGVLYTPLNPELRVPALQAAGLALLVSLVVPAAAYKPLLGTTVRKSVWVSVFQWLLRGFLYVLVTAIVMVVLAVIQIVRGTPS